MRALFEMCKCVSDRRIEASWIERVAAHPRMKLFILEGYLGSAYNVCITEGQGHTLLHYSRARLIWRMVGGQLWGWAVALDQTPSYMQFVEVWLRCWYVIWEVGWYILSIRSSSPETAWSSKPRLCLHAKCWREPFALLWSIAILMLLAYPLMSRIPKIPMLLLMQLRVFFSFFRNLFLRNLLRLTLMVVLGMAGMVLAISSKVSDTRLLVTESSYLFEPSVIEAELRATWMSIICAVLDRRWFL